MVTSLSLLFVGAKEREKRGATGLKRDVSVVEKGKKKNEKPFG